MQSSLAKIAFVGVLIVSAFTIGCPPIIPPMGSVVPPARPSALPGVWLGEDARGFGTIYRLELYSGGHGVLAVSGGEGEPRTDVYDIERWTVDDRGRMTFTLRPASSSDAAQLRVKGVASLLGITLLRADPNCPTEWFECATMLRDAEFMKELDQKRIRLIDAERHIQKHKSE